jgi:rhodanese-related sulfurtransferase
MRSISVAQLAAQLKNEKPLLLDVREPWEYEICHIDGSINTQLKDATEIVVICHHGIRSQNVIRFLQQQSVDGLVNLDGGVDAWAREVDLDMPLY